MAQADAAPSSTSSTALPSLHRADYGLKSADAPTKQPAHLPPRGLRRAHMPAPATRNGPLAAYVMLTLASLFWAGNFVMGRWSAEHVPPLALSCLR